MDEKRHFVELKATLSALILVMVRASRGASRGASRKFLLPDGFQTAELDLPTPVTAKNGT